MTFESGLSVPDSVVACFYPRVEEGSFRTKEALPNKRHLEEDHDHTPSSHYLMSHLEEEEGLRRMLMEGRCSTRHALAECLRACLRGKHNEDYSRNRVDTPTDHHVAEVECLRLEILWTWSSKSVSFPLRALFI